MFILTLLLLLPISVFADDGRNSCWNESQNGTEVFNEEFLINNFNDCFEYIIEYTPNIFETKVYDIKESELVDMALRIANTQNEENKNYALAILYSTNLDMPQEIREQLLNIGINFSYSTKTEDSLCSAIDEAITDKEVNLVDDYYEMSISEVKSELFEDIELYFQGIQQGVDLYSFQCNGKFLYELKEELLNLDYWDLESYFMADSEIMLEYLDLPRHFNKLKSEDIITMKSFNFKVELEIGESCKDTLNVKDSLLTIIHNKLLETSRAFPEKDQVTFIYSQEVSGCYMSIQYKYIKETGIRIEDFIEANF